MERIIKQGMEVPEVPKNLKEVNEFLGKIRKKQHKIEEINKELNDKIKELKEKAMQESEPLRKEISQLSQGIFAFAQSHRDELFKSEKKKSIQLSNGSFGWRITPPSVFVRNAKLILEKLKLLGLKSFIRTRESIDKEAILSAEGEEAEKIKRIKGISVKQFEEFIIKPTGVEVEIAFKVKEIKIR